MATTGALGKIGGVNDTAHTREDRIFFNGFTAGTQNGAVEYIFQLPDFGKGYSWKLVDVNISVGVNTTHSSAGLINLTVEKNTDGGTSALTTSPSISDAAGTGRRTTANGAATGIIAAVIDDDESTFDPGDTAFVTVLEAGSGGTDPSDVSVCLEFQRISNFTPTA